jgi:hypothetical protein
VDVIRTIEMPIRYAGPGEWSVFERPQSYRTVVDKVVAVPGTQVRHRCLFIPFELWNTLRQMSLWIEALCTHEWCLFTERSADVNRGAIFAL